MCVEGFYFLYPLNGKRILFGAIRQHIPHQVSENISFDEIGHALRHLDRFAVVGEALQCIKISIEFVVETAFESPALAAKFCLIDR